MKSYKKYLCIYLPIALLCLLINHLKKHDDTPANIPYHLFFDFEKDEYDVKDLVTGEKIGDISLKKENNSFYIDFYTKATAGILKGSVIESKYNYQELKLNNFLLEKHTDKNLEYFSGKINDLFSVVIFTLEDSDYRNFYRSNNKKRYLFFIVKNSYLNFFINDESVHDLYTSFGIGDDTKYAAIFE